MMGNKYGLLQKLERINDRDVNLNNEPVRFFLKPTAINIHSLNRKGQHLSQILITLSIFHVHLSLFLYLSLVFFLLLTLEKYFKDWNKILLDKDEKERVDNFAIISRDDITRRKAADEMKIAADRQAKYENQLKKMGIPVIVGLVRNICSLLITIELLSIDLIFQLSHRDQLIVISHPMSDLCILISKERQ
jgi:hypothetical protein